MRAPCGGDGRGRPRPGRDVPDGAWMTYHLRHSTAMILPSTHPTPAVGTDELLGRAAELEAMIANAGWDAAHRAQLLDLAVDARGLAGAMAETTPRAAFHLLEAAGAPGDGLTEDEVLDRLDALQVALLEIREEEPVADSRDVREIVTWMLRELGATQQQFAAAVGVPHRTFQRWMTVSPMPAGDERRIRLVLRGLNEVRFALRGGLALRWLTHPNPGARHRSPIDLIDQPREFLDLASRVRFG